ncbi:MAG TPA: hypothetical protein VMH80_17370 [Bryobacteraceae bacterium]|nr:hypothetical protein [Bryobacteraceae bacterium]
MNNAVPKPHIPESFFEHRQVFAEPWVERWGIPNPFISALFPLLRDAGAELTDYSFNNSAANVGETYLNIAVRKFNAGVRIGLDTVTFLAGNPYWEMAPHLIALFDRVSSTVHDLVGHPSKYQEATLAFHVTPGPADFKSMTARFVNVDLLGECLFYGASLHRDDSVLIIDKSLRHEGAAFVRLQRTFPGNVLFAEIASRLYQDEVAALRLLGIAEVP